MGKEMEATILEGFYRGCIGNCYVIGVLGL